MIKRQIHIAYKDIVVDRPVVDKIFSAAAKMFNLFDNTLTSRVPNTIKSIVEKDGYGFGLGARVVDKLIVVDFFPNRSPVSLIFDDVCQYIDTELSLAFPENLHEAKEHEFVPTH